MEDPTAVLDVFVRRTAVRAAKRWKYRHLSVEMLSRRELDILFSARDWPRRLVELWRPRMVLPCVRCGDPGGDAARGYFRPMRIAGGRFGIEGALCKTCYDGLDKAERYRRRGGGVGRTIRAAPRRVRIEFGWRWRKNPGA